MHHRHRAFLKALFNLTDSPNSKRNASTPQSPRHPNDGTSASWMHVETRREELKVGHEDCWLREVAGSLCDYPAGCGERQQAIGGLLAGAYVHPRARNAW